MMRIVSAAQLLGMTVPWEVLEQIDPSYSRLSGPPLASGCLASCQAALIGSSCGA
jgi:hypothetical protein